MTDKFSEMIVSSYDPNGTVIRLSYDPDNNRDYKDDPSFIHEMVHYGQNIMTGLGLVQSLMFNNIYYAITKILSFEKSLILPLSKCLHSDNNILYWNIVALFNDFQQTNFSDSNLCMFVFYKKEYTKIKETLLSSIYNPCVTNPFYFKYKWQKCPGFGIKYGDNEKVFFEFDGRFIQELHAYTTEFIIRCQVEKLEIDDLVNYYIFMQKNPFILLCLAVQKMITERTGKKNSIDVFDAVFICHLSAQISLNGLGLETVTNLPWEKIHTPKIQFSYRIPGEIFFKILSATFEKFVGPGWAVNNYFKLMSAALAELGWPQFEHIMDSITKSIEKFIDFSSARNINDYFTKKMKESRLAIDWLVKQYKKQNVIDFIYSPCGIIENKIVSGPVIISPNKFNMLHIEKDKFIKDIPKTNMYGLFNSFITHKILYTQDITCLEPFDSPLHGSSIIGCEYQNYCQKKLESKNKELVCTNHLWYKTLENYPGLLSKVDELGWLKWDFSDSFGLD